MATAVETPLDLIRLSLDEYIKIKCRNGQQVKGKLHGYDEHLNMVLGDVEETTYPASQGSKPTVRRFEMLFLRGDIIVLVAPPPRTT